MDKKKCSCGVAVEDRINIVGRHVSVTEGMKNHAIDKISKIDRFHTHITDVHVALDVQKLNQICTIVLKFNHWKVKVSATTTDMYASIDKAVNKLQSKLRRWKDRIQNHHKPSLSQKDMHVDVMRPPFDTPDESGHDDEIDVYQSPQVIGIDSRPLKSLTIEEAMMKMELSGDHFMIFKGEEDRKLKVIYKRSDNNYGIILVE